MGWNVSVGWKNMPCITFHREPTVWAGMYLWAGKICLVSLSIESLQCGLECICGLEKYALYHFP